MAIYNGQGELIDIEAKVDTFDVPIITGVCPHVYITCNGTALSNLGSTAVKGTIRFDDGKTKFTLYTKMKAQGDQSLNYNQKQINATLYSDEACKTKQKVKFNDWMPLSKFHIKSHPQDPIQCRNAVVASVMRKIVGTGLPNGAWGFIGAFPVIVYWNGDFAGCYCWTTPQDGKTFNFSDSKELSCENLAYRFSEEYRGDEDETADMIAVKDALFDVIENSSLTKAIIEEHFNVTSILQMICAIEWFSMRDVVEDNSLVVTWDGTTWYTLPYDFDWSIPGRTLWISTKVVNDNTSTLPLTFLRQVELLYSDEIKDVYASMRQNGMDTDTVMNALTDFYKRWNYVDREEDVSDWSDNPYVASDANFAEIRSTMTSRSLYVDSLYDYTE